MAYARWPGHPLTGCVMACAALMGACSGDDGPPDESGGTEVTLSFCASDTPIWLAVQDGDAEWNRLDPLEEGLYEARFTADRGGVAYVSSAGSSLVVNYGSLTELGSIACNSGFKLVTGTVAGLAEGDNADIYLGGSYTGGSSFFELLDVADGPLDLIASRLISSPDGSYIANRIVIRRAQNPAPNSQMPVIDFASAESFTPAIAAASVTGADDATSVRLISSWHGRALPVANLSASYGAGPAQYAAVPLDQLGQGEFASLLAATNEYPRRSGRFATVFFRTPVDKVVSVGPHLSTPVVTWPTWQRPRLQLASQPEYGRLVAVTYHQNFDAVSVAMTSAYLGGTPAAWDLQLPDLSSVDGWNSAWSLGAEPAISWRVVVEGGYDRGLGDTLHDGDVAASAYIDGGDGPFFIRALPGINGTDWHRGGFPGHSGREK